MSVDRNNRGYFKLSYQNARSYFGNKNDKQYAILEIGNDRICKVITEFSHINSYSEPIFKPHKILSGQLYYPDTENINARYRHPDVPRGINLVKWINEKEFYEYIS